MSKENFSFLKLNNPIQMKDIPFLEQGNLDLNLPLFFL